MDTSFYAAARAAITQQDRMAVLSNNIANVNSYGYKSKSAVFQDLFYYNIRERGIDDSNLAAGTGARISHTNTDMTQAGLEATDGEYDYAIWGDGMFMLRHPTDGEITYTRNGRFSLSSRQDGFYLVSDSGCLVLDENQQPIKLEDGALSALPGIFKAENTDGILSVGNSEYQFRAKNGQVTLATDSQLMEGYLELSNVDLTAEFTGLIEAQRAYGFALKMVQTSDEVEQTIVNLR